MPNVTSRFGLAATLFFIACSDTPTQPNGVVQVALHKTRASVNEPILVTIANASPQDAYLWHCDHRVGFIVEQRKGGSWTEVFGVNGPACPADRPMGQIVVESGRQRTESFSISQKGEFRLRLEFGGQYVRILYIRHSVSFFVD